MPDRNARSDGQRFLKFQMKWISKSKMMGRD